METNQVRRTAPLPRHADGPESSRTNAVGSGLTDGMISGNSADIRKTDIVRSTAGRDRGKLFAVLDTDGEYLLLADGRGRRIESPKRKKRRHAEFVASSEETRLSRKIRGEGRLTNSELRRTLAAYREALCAQEECPPPEAPSAEQRQNTARQEG